jgi:type I restriction enzyme S subunit
LNSAERAGLRPKGNVPTLRFPEFSGEWHHTTIGDCCSPLEYGMNAPAKEYDGSNKYIRITDIDEDTCTYKCDDVVSPNAQLEDKYKVRKNDILFARTGASTGKAYLYNEKDGLMYYAGFLIRGNVKPTYNAKFVFLQTQTQKYKKWVDIMSIRSGQPGINSQEYSGFKFHLPPLKVEQDKISTLFTLLDERITTQIRVINELQSLMQGLEQTLLKPQSSWTSCFIGDVLSIGSGRDYKHLSKGDIPVYGTGGYMLSVNDFLYDGESVCIGRKGTIDKPLYLHCKFWTVDTLFYTYDFREILPRYCYYLFNTINWLKYNEASGVPSLSKDTIERIKISIPSIEEQKRVCDIIDSVDEKLSLENTLLEKMISLKQFLLSSLFV